MLILAEKIPCLSCLPPSPSLITWTFLFLQQQTHSLLLGFFNCWDILCPDFHFALTFSWSTQVPPFWRGLLWLPHLDQAPLTPSYAFTSLCLFPLKHSLENLIVFMVKRCLLTVKKIKLSNISLCNGNKHVAHLKTELFPLWTGARRL